MKVSYQDLQQKNETIFSSPYLVENLNSPPSGSITISGQLKEDQTINMVTTNLSDGDGLPIQILTYINGRKPRTTSTGLIKGATSSSYSLSIPMSVIISEGRYLIKT